MEKIIQLTEREYEKLTETSNLKVQEIIRRADEMYKKKGTYGIVLELRCGQEYQDEIKFSAYTYVKDWDGRFPISEEDKRRIVRFVDYRALEYMERKFGRQIHDINFWKKRLDYLKKWQAKFIGLTIFGWLAALALLLLVFLKWTK